MPANRSRTERWRDCLADIAARGGVIELAVDRRSHGDQPDNAHDGVDLVWRVRLLALEGDALRVESPAAVGRRFPIASGVALVGVMAIGQNRWLFDTIVDAVDRSAPTPVLRLKPPTNVRRESRRQHTRFEADTLSLPLVKCWSLADPGAATPFQVACRHRIQDLLAGANPPEPTDNNIDNELWMPPIGRGFEARLANIGGGGVGLIIEPEGASAVDGGRLYWMRLELSPIIPAPLDITARMAHTRLDSLQRIHAGMAFEFTLDPAHREFVARLIDRCMRAAGATPEARPTEAA